MFRFKHQYNLAYLIERTREEEDNYNKEYINKLNEQHNVYEDVIKNINNYNNSVNNLVNILKTSLKTKIIKKNKNNKNNTEYKHENFYVYVMSLLKTKNYDSYPITDELKYTFKECIKTIKYITRCRDEIISNYPLLKSPYELLIYSDVHGTSEFLDAIHTGNYYNIYSNFYISDVEIPSITKYRELSYRYKELKQDMWFENNIPIEYVNIKTKLVELKNLIKSVTQSS